MENSGWLLFQTSLSRILIWCFNLRCSFEIMLWDNICIMLCDIIYMHCASLFAWVSRLSVFYLPLMYSGLLGWPGWLSAYISRTHFNNENPIYGRANDNQRERLGCIRVSELSFVFWQANRTMDNYPAGRWLLANLPSCDFRIRWMRWKQSLAMIWLIFSIHLFSSLSFTLISSIHRSPLVYVKGPCPRSYVHYAIDRSMTSVLVISIHRIRIKHQQE